MWQSVQPPIAALARRLRSLRPGFGMKSALFFLLYSAAIIGAMAVTAHLDQRRQAEELTEQRLKGLAVALEARIQAFLRGSRHQMLSLIDSYPLRRYANALEEGSPGELEFATAQVADLLRAHLAAHAMHYQARLIDARSGWELMRLDKDRYTDAIHSAEDLQDKSHRDYFQELKGGGADRFYVSAVNLNREHGAVETPHRPTLRLAARLRGKSDRPVAFLVINISFASLMSDLHRILGDSHVPLVLDSLTRYLVHPDRRRAFAFEFGRVESLAVDAPEVAARLLGPHAPGMPYGEVFTPDLPIRGEPYMAALRVMPMQGGDNRRTLIVGAAMPARQVYPSLLGSVTHSREALVVLLLVALSATFLVARARAHGQRVAATHAKLKGVLETAQDGIVITDGAGRIEEANPAAGRLFGVKGAELVGKPLDALVPALAAADPSRFRKGVWQPSEAKEAADPDDHAIEMARRADGREFPVHVSLAELPDPRQRRLAAILHDQSDMVAARQAAVAANLAKSQFLTAMSHELRTPLNAVLLYSQMVAEDLADSASPEVLADLERIHQAGAHLMDLINGVLDLARIETGRMELNMATFDLAEMVADTVSLAGPVLRQNGNQLLVDVADDMGMIVGDRVKLRQCMINLISNAAKFTEQGAVTIAGWRQHDMVFLSVADTGIGMDEEQLGRVFNVFEQASTQIKAKYGGSGVGLALTRQFIDLMGGQIEVSSQLGEGSCFTISLPAVAVSTSPPSPDQVNVGQRMKVLVVDDDPAMRALLGSQLEPNLYEVVGLPGGQQALEYLASHAVDLILMDILMPEMDGWDTLRVLKAEPRTANIPVLVVSIVGDREISEVQGACGHVRKPFRADDIAAAIERCQACRMGRSVVIVEDDLNMRAALVRAVERVGLPAVAFFGVDDALYHVRLRRPGAILLDLQMARGPSGFDMLDELANEPALAEVPVFVITGVTLSVDQRAALAERCQMVLEKGAFDLDGLMAHLLEFISGECPNDRPGASDRVPPAAPPALRMVGGEQP
ncbi:response regulator [Roseospirillum parvum]|uniref:histidine kinase n=1 Tax=Roseospirillum parvum TaxID=83401 RepID=A0A1G8BV56_9PROT|nr:response regulator [Roseospirillum parvum]SDH36949.1 PAS domain S-box-containing protein [Roseospirillum parvum]